MSRCVGSLFRLASYGHRSSSPGGRGPTPVGLRRPVKLHADKGHDFPTCPRALRRRGISPAHRPA
jgi:hypothetical protein